MDVTEQVLRVGHVIGSCYDAAFHDAIHALEHRDAVDVVELPADDLARRRILTRTRGGREIAIALPREQRLFGGAILYLDDKQAVIVRAQAERWIRFEPREMSDAIELGYHAGNLHWRVRFDGEALLVPLEGRLEDYEARLGEMVATGRVALSVINDAARSGASRPAHHHHHHHHLHGGENG
jgi:urease accessory protein